MVQRFGLAWNPNKKGHILGASEDKTVCHWQGYLCCTPFSRVLTISRLRDLNAYSKANSTIEPLTVFKDHTAVVGVRFASQMPSYMKLMPPDTKDVDWHASNENVFVSVGDDKMLKMCAFHFLFCLNKIRKILQLGYPTESPNVFHTGTRSRDIGRRF